jgi:hypothetical protein
MESPQRRPVEQQFPRTEVRLLDLEERAGPKDVFDTPLRALSADEIQCEVRRLMAICVQHGVGAVAPQVRDCAELLEALALACKKEGLALAGEYLLHLARPNPPRLTQ